jgi:hypothetical protein
MSKKLQTHLDEDFAREIEAEAARRGISTSELVREILKRYFRDEQLSDQLQRTDAERRVEELVATGRDEIVATADAIRQIVARDAVYQIAMWELQKRHYSWHDKQRRAALSIGSERLREPLEDLGVDVDLLATSVDPDDIAETENGEPEEYGWLSDES